ncbi:hypothetical protein [Arthrobacter sp. D1-17]
MPAGQVPADSAAPAIATITTPAAPAVATTTTSAIATTTTSAAPAIATVSKTVVPVVSSVASATKRLLPVVKLPQLHQGIPVATVPKPLRAAKSAVPPSPASDIRRPLASRSSVAIDPSRAAAGSPTTKASSYTPALALSGISSPAGPNPAAIQDIDSPVKTFAQLRMTTSARPLAGAVQAPPGGPWDERPATERWNFAATHGESGSSGSDSSGSHTADIAAAWNVASPAASAHTDGAFVTPPSGPAVDPGSSPD